MAQSAKQALSSGNEDLAIYYYHRAVQMQPKQLALHVWLAEALLKRGNIDQALEAAKAALAIKKDEPRAKAVVDEVLRPTPTPTPVSIEADAVAVPFPQPSEDGLPKGLAVWVFGPAAPAAKLLNEHSQSVSMSQRFATVFVPCGELVFKNGVASLEIDLKPALELAEQLIGDVRILPVIKGNSRGANNLTPAEWDRIGALIASKVDSDSRIAGVQFDVQPQRYSLFGLYAGVKNHTRKPVTAVVRDWHKLIFKYVDAVVLQAFGRAGDIQGYKGAATAVINGFLRDARSMDGQGIIGLPAAAATEEFETRTTVGGANPPADARIVATGVAMDQFLDEGLFAVQAAIQINDPAFLGVAIWAVHPEGGIRPSLEPLWYHPSLISDKIWQRLRLPLFEGR